MKLNILLLWNMLDSARFFYKIVIQLEIFVW